jgi:hypothetical protein
MKEDQLGDGRKITSLVIRALKREAVMKLFDKSKKSEEMKVSSENVLQEVCCIKCWH